MSSSPEQANIEFANKLSTAEWKSRALKYESKVKKWTEPFRDRRKVGQAHPVEDFLFIYYRFSPKKLEEWHPGTGIWLERDCHEEVFSSSNCYSTAGDYLHCDPALMSTKERNRIEWTIELLQATDERRPNFSCLGLHEWAMVYHGQEVRHEKTTPLRLPQAEIDQLVESRPITCSHFDAFRFFAEDAKPLNRLLPTLESRPNFEQPACIHANMDLYKWAFKAMPWVGSGLLFQCFELAMFAREVDMRASPYDLSAYGEFQPIKIETSDGRAEYEQAQRAVAERAAPLRLALLEKLRSIVS